MKKTEYLTTVIILLACGLAPAETLPAIVPAPQELEWTSGQPAWIEAKALTGVRAQRVRPARKQRWPG